MCKDSQISRILRLVILPVVKNVCTLKTNLLLGVQRIGNITFKLKVLDTNNTQMFVEVIHINTSTAKRSVTSKFIRKTRFPKHIAHHLLHEGYRFCVLRSSRNIITKAYFIPES